MQRVYGIAIKKGGQGKSTTVSTLARLCAIYGARVLVVDLAQPGSVSTSLRDSWPHSQHGTFGELLDPFCLLEENDRPHPDDVLAALDALQLPVPLIAKPSWGGGLMNILPYDDLLGSIGRRLRSPFVVDGVLRSIDSAFDIMLIDFPADDSILLDNALMATDRLIVPFVAEAATLEGIDATLRMLRDGCGGRARATLGGMILTHCEPRNKRAGDIVNTLLHSGEVEGEVLKDRIFPFAIRHSDFFDHAFRYGEPVWERTQDQRVWSGYVLLAEWLLADAGLDHLIANRRNAALLEDDTRVMDTVAVATGVGTGEARLREFRIAHSSAPGSLQYGT
jgi:cellulose biosynthesis protein BcsQ